MMRFVAFFVLAFIMVSGNALKLNAMRKPSIFRSNVLLRSVLDCQKGEFDQAVIKQSSSTPVIVDFYADWCGPCKLVAPIFKQLAEEMPSVKFVKVDTDKDEEAVEQFNIQGLPLFAMFIDGKIVASHSGAMSKDNLKKFIDNAVSKK